MTKHDTTQIKQHISNAKDILIVTHEKPTADSVGSALALRLALQSMGKNVTVACPDLMTVELSSFVGANKVQKDVSQKNFIVSLDYVEGSIEKVSYNIEGDKFNLVIEPREGFEPFSQEKVSYSYAGSRADIIFCIDTIHLGGLKSLYEGEKNLFASKPLVNIDHHPNNVNYGTVNIVDPKASSTAELVAGVIDDLGVSWSVDIATNILNALYEATDNFTSKSVTAGAFETAARCIKLGGRKFVRQSGGQLPTVDIPTQEQKTEQPVPQAAPQVSQPSAPDTHAPAPDEPEKKEPEEAKRKDAPADWLRPKIFKSSNT